MSTDNTLLWRIEKKQTNKKTLLFAEKWLILTYGEEVTFHISMLT